MARGGIAKKAGRGGSAATGRGASSSARGARGGGRGGRGGRGGASGRGKVVSSTPPRPSGPQYEVINVNVPFRRFTPRELDAKKTELLNMVAAAMLSEPKASATSPLFMKILTASREVAYYDPEFLLKLAMYVRLDLNIRSTANYLLAMSSNIKECQPFVAKYYEDCIRLPSDWLEVVAIYMTLPDRTVLHGIPTCLRKAMIDKFPAFDEYQLGKYNKERNLRRKQKKWRDRAAKQGIPIPKPEKPPVTLKQMIRQLHMSQPPFAVMALLGKRYPRDMEEFRASGLPGTFDPNLASTRIKLPVPETWETMLSEKGNKATTWESLIDHKKLPFMAMLRNLRNLILTGVSERHHRWAQSKLTNEDTIAMSRQFPFRFFSAYEVIPENQEALKKLLAPKTTKPVKEGQPETKMRVKKNPIIPKFVPSDETLRSYRSALDQAVKHATTNNVDPIKGSTVVFCNVSAETRADAPGARGMGGAVKNIAQLGYLLGLMCKYVCEECDFRIWASPPQGDPNAPCHLPVELEEGTILANMERVAQQATKLGLMASPFPLDYLQDLIARKVKIDNLLVLSHKTLDPDADGGESNSASSSSAISQSNHNLASLLLKYRTEVNPELLFVSVNLSGSGKASIGSSAQNPNNILISGFSEQILRFIAERGGDGQLQYVENIDEAKGINARLEAKRKALNPDPSPWWKWLETLTDVAQAKPVYPNLLNNPRPWTDVRVFISSTFLDMHGERDVLTRLVFPELKSICKKRRINLIEVDLRWGITEEQSQHAQSIQLCLSEVKRCTFFVGMLGERYGWAPAKYEVPKESEAEFAFLKHFPTGRSITELEFEVAGLHEAMGGAPLTDRKPKESFFYLRDKSFISAVPEEYRKAFEPDSSQAKEKMLNLKKRLVASGMPVRKRYPADWKGLEDGKPLAGNLTEFADLVFADLSSAIERCFPVDAEEEDECTDDVMLEMVNEETSRAADPFTNVFHRAYHQVMHQRSVQQSLVDSVTKQFYGRQEQLDAMHKFANPPPALSNMSPTQKSHMLVLHGSSGDGKTALMATFAKRLAAQDPHLFVLSHFCGAGHGSNDLHTMLTRLCWEIKSAFHLNDEDAVVPTDIKLLQVAFGEMLKAAAFKGRLIVLLDAVDELINDNSTRAHALEWLPLELPCKFIISTTTSLAVEDKVAASSGFQYRTSLSAPVDNTTNNQVLDTIRNRKIPNLVEVRMSPLSVDERTKFIRDTLWEYHKRLDERPMNNQMRILLRKTDCGKPIYIQVACEELRVFGVYEQVAEKIASLGPTTSKLFETVLQRLETDHTTSLVESFFVALLASRDGLSEEELAAATGVADWETSREWKHLMRAVLPFLRSTTPYLAIFHEHLAMAAAKRYLRRGSRSLPSVHSKIANFLYNQADPSRVGLSVWRDSPIRVLSELPYHLLGAGMFEDLERVLTDLNFVEAKACAALTFDLVNDFQVALNPNGSLMTGPQKTVGHIREKLKQYLAFVKQNAFVLHSEASLTFQQAANEPDATAPAQYANKVWQSASGKNSVSNDWFEWMNKPQAHAACKMTYNALGEAMLATAVTPDGNVLAMAGKECVIKLFNARTGAELGVIPPSAHGHTQWIVSLNFSPDSRFMVSGSWDGTAKVWDVATRTHLFTLSGHRRRVNYAAFSPINGRYVVTASWDNAARVFDLQENGQLVKTIKEHNRPLNCAIFSPDEKCILTASWDGTIKMIEANVDVSTRHKVLKVFAGHTGSVTSIAMSPNGLSLISSSRDQRVNMWDAVSGKLISSLESHNKPVLSVSFSWDGQFIATTSADCSVRVFKATLGTLAWRVSSPVDGSYMTTVCAHPTKPLIATGSSDCNIYIWNTVLPDSGPVATLERKHNRPINCLAWSPDGKWLASCAEEPYVLLWDATQNYKFAGKATEHLHPVNAVAFNPQTVTPILASACDGFDVRLWNYVTKRPYVPPQAEKEGLTDPSILKGHESTIKGLSWHPKGRLLASASRDRTAKIWDTQTGKCIKTLRGHKDWLNCVSFSPDGQKAVTGAWDYHVKHWNLRQEEASMDPPALTAHDGPVCQVHYINKGMHFISAASDGKLVVWDAQGGTVVSVLHGHSSRINATSVTSSGYVISVSDDGTIAMWSPLEPIEVATLTGHANTVRAVAFAPAADKYLLYSASDDQTVKVWDAGIDKHAISEDQTVASVISPLDEKSSNAKASADAALSFKTTIRLPLDASEQQINDIAVGSSKNTIFTVSDSGLATVYDAEVAAALTVYTHPGARGMRAVASGSASSTSFSKTLFSGCDAGIVSAFDTRAPSTDPSFTLSDSSFGSSTLQRAHRGPVTSISFFSDHLVTTGWDHAVLLWDLKKTSSPVTRIETMDWMLSAKFVGSASLNPTKFVAVGWEGFPWCAEGGAQRKFRYQQPSSNASQLRGAGTMASLFSPCMSDVAIIGGYSNQATSSSRGSGSTLFATSSMMTGSINFFEVSNSAVSITAKSQFDFVASAGARVNRIASSTTSSGVTMIYVGGEDSIMRSYMMGTQTRPISVGSFPCKAPVTALTTDASQDRIWMGDRIGHLYLIETRSQS